MEGADMARDGWRGRPTRTSYFLLGTQGSLSMPRALVSRFTWVPPARSGHYIHGSHRSALTQPAQCLRWGRDGPTSENGKRAGGGHRPLHCPYQPISSEQPERTHRLGQPIRQGRAATKRPLRPKRDQGRKGGGDGGGASCVWWSR